MKGFTALFALAAMAVLGLTLRPVARDGTSTAHDFGEERSRLGKLARHLDPATPEGEEVAEQLEELEEQEEKAENPAELARYLYERTVPYGETLPDYAPGYRTQELQRAVANAPASPAVLPWVERGPANVTGRVRGIVVDPDDPSGDTWFVGSVGGGIWKTTNAGDQWTEVAPYLANFAVSAIAMAPSNHNILYAGTGESMFSVDVINGDGMLKSTDHGATWAPIASTVGNINFNNIARIVIDPTNPDVVLAATSVGRYKIDISNTSGIWKSTDGGVTWSEKYREEIIGQLGRVKKVLQLADMPGDFNTIFGAIDERGIIKSTDAGDTWFFSSTGIDDTTGRFELAIAPSNPDKIYAAAEGATTSNLYMSGDAGATWVKTTPSGSNPNWLSAQGWYDNTIVVNPFDENVVYVGGVNLYRMVMSDTMRTTATISAGPVHVDHHNLVTIPRAGGGFRILNANDGGIGLSSDSSVGWTKPTIGLNTTQFYGVDKKPGASAYIGGMQDNGTWRSPEDADAASLWVSQIGGDGYEASWHFNDPLKLIGGSQYNGIRRSTNGGLSFSSGTTGLTNTGSGNAPFITKIGKTNMEPDLLFAVGSSGVFRSTNFGANWALTAIPSSTWGAISSFHDVEVSRANPDIVWGGARMDPDGKIHVSTDRGLTFTPVPDYTVTALGGISGIATHPHQDSTAYILFSFAHKPKVIRTTDLGQTWEDISGFGSGPNSTNGFPDVAVYDLIVMPHTPDTIWVGTEIGLFESTDNGAHWHYANNGFPAVSIWDMTHVEDEVVIGTHGRGVWSVTIPGMSLGQTFAPLLKDLFQGPDGTLAIAMTLRSLYDSTVVSVNGLTFARLGPNATQQDTLLHYPVMETGTDSVVGVSYRNGTAYPSASRLVPVVLFSPAQASYTNRFNDGTMDFTGNGFRISLPVTFADSAIHSNHPYSNNQNYTYMLTVPIVVASANAFVAYDDVVIVEPGEPGSVFGDPSFYDYVVVEGSSDGATWTPLADGYDSRADSAWLAAYTANAPGDSTLFRHHELNLLDTYAAGETILLRFRLFTDASSTRWGWAVDNLEVQDRLTGVSSQPEIPSDFALSQNYPNPFNPSTTIRYALPADAHTVLKIFDITGSEIAVLVDALQKPGFYSCVWDGRNAAGRTVATGVYLYRIEARRVSGSGGDFVQTNKMVLLH